MNPAHILTDVVDSSWGSPNGGQQRSRQLQELIASTGFEMRGLPPLSGVSNLRRYAAGLKCCCQLQLWGRVPMRQLRHHGAQWLRFQAANMQYRGRRVFLWQSTHLNNLSLPFIARKLGFRVMAAPHNLEALVPAKGKTTLARLPELAAEASAIRSCDAVFTIAREEVWLLAALGVAAVWLPYHPPKTLRETLLTVREQRRVKPGTDRWFMLGTAENPPTYLGMKQVIEWLKTSEAGRVMPLDVVGRGTESLRPLAQNTACRVLGNLDADGVQELWSTARGLLVHQVSGAGALTRIRDALYAGLPVVANEVAARSYSLSEGVSCYYSSATLLPWLQSRLEIPPIPGPSTSAEEHFKETLRGLLQTPLPVS